MSAQRLVHLEPVDALDVTIVVDNAIDDLAASTELAQLQPNPPDYFAREHLRAEHGYSLLRGKGLVVVSSCSHAGAINVLEHSRRLTGVQHVHAFVGGVHLTGGLFEPITFHRR